MLVTRAADDAAALSDRLRAAGLDPVEVPLLAIAHPSPPDWAGWGRLDLVVFSSVRAVDALGAPPSAGPPCAAVGPATADRARALGWEVQLVASPHTAEALAAQAQLRGRRVLVPRSAEATEALVEAIGEAGAEAIDWIAYQNAVPTEAAQALRATPPCEVVTLCSVSAARRYAALRDPEDPARIACIGPSTATAALEAGLEVHAVAAPHTLDGLVEAALGLTRR